MELPPPMPIVAVQIQIRDVVKAVKPRLADGIKTSCAKGVSKKIRVHAFGDCCPVVVFTIIAVPENNLVATAVCQL